MCCVARVGASVSKEKKVKEGIRGAVLEYECYHIHSTRAVAVKPHRNELG